MIFGEKPRFSAQTARVVGIFDKETIYLLSPGQTVKKVEPKPAKLSLLATNTRRVSFE